MLLAESLLGTSSVAANYIEDVFSTYLYTGNGSTQTITNGIDLSGKGGLVWMKGRSGATNHALYDTARGATFDIASNTTAAQTTQATGLTSFDGTGFSIGALAKINTSAATYASWTFRKQAKFFDVVTYTGNGVDGRAISHNLGSVPGCILLKKTSAADDWYVYHRSGGTGTNNGLGVLNSTAAFDTGSNAFGGPGNVSVAPTSTTFTIRSSLNDNGATYVAYLFAHNAGGFGATGTDNVISCGSFTTDGSGNVTVTLGYEPQFLIVKRTDSADSWKMLDNMRGWPNGGNDSLLYPNLANAESAPANYGHPTATGFTGTFDASAAHIYIAIRRGPMKTPTTGTSVFAANYGSDTTTYTTNFPLDSAWDTQLPAGSATSGTYIGARLLGGKSLVTTSTAAENTTVPPSTFWQSNTSYRWNTFGNECSTYALRRAPGFFDVVCYTGNGSNRTITHNLGVTPELIIIKSRSNAYIWTVYNATVGATKALYLNTNDAQNTDSGEFNNTAPTSSVFSVGTNNGVNANNATFVAYLFATVAGVSKVGSYTGTGTTKQIDCGFTGGARFVLIKRTDSTGDWYVWDSARGIVAGNDPYYRLNTTSSEVTNTDYVDTYSAGFEISSTAPAAINANGGSFIFLAIA